jgi:DNA-binding response OmpR family regulator
VTQLRRELAVPAVLMSGSWTASEMEQAASVGAAVLDKPFRQVDLVAALARAVAQRQTGRPRVLIAHSASDGLSERLAALGYEVIVCTTGMAEVAAESMGPHLILIDAGADGWGAVRRVRERAWGRTVRILAVGGCEDADQRSEWLAAGCDGFLTRPVAAGEVASLLTDRISS